MLVCAGEGKAPCLNEYKLVKYNSKNNNKLINYIIVISNPPITFHVDKCISKLRKHVLAYLQFNNTKQNNIYNNQPNTFVIYLQTKLQYYLYDLFYLKYLKKIILLN